MMLNNSKIVCTFAVIFSALCFCSCDDGRIYDEGNYNSEGFTVRLTATLTGMDTWPENYSIALAGFKSGTDYRVIAKDIPPSDEGKESEVEMSGVGGDVQTIELCALNRFGERVTTFHSQPTEGARNEIVIELGAVDVSAFAAIQKNLLDNSCTGCHGAGGAGIGLDLRAGHSFAALVGKPSKKVEGKKLIEPGNAGESVFSQVIQTQVSANWKMNHSDMLNKERTALLREFIDRWINAGAKK